MRGRGGRCSRAASTGDKAISLVYPLILPLAILLFSIPLVLALVRANEIFYLRIDRGQVRKVRGRIPPKLLEDVRDIIKRKPPETGWIRAVIEDRRVSVYADGELSPEQKQQLKNVVGLWPLPKLRS
jgi:hypothetical protein